MTEYARAEMDNAVRRRLFEKITCEERSKPQMELGSIRKMNTLALCLSLLVQTWLVHSFLNLSIQNENNST